MKARNAPKTARFVSCARCPRSQLVSSRELFRAAKRICMMVWEEAFVTTEKETLLADEDS